METENDNTFPDIAVSLPFLVLRLRCDVNWLTGKASVLVPACISTSSFSTSFAAPEHPSSAAVLRGDLQGESLATALHPDKIGI